MYEIYKPEKIADILATIPLVSPPNDIIIIIAEETSAEETSDVDCSLRLRDKVKDVFFDFPADRLCCLLLGGQGGGIWGNRSLVYGRS